VSRPLRSWLVNIASIFGVVATLALGQWQLGRGRDKDALQAAIDQRESMPVLSQSFLLQADAEVMNRRVVVRGSWDSAHTVFLDNRQMRGAPGFYVVTPLKLEGSNLAVLVQRGWVPRNFEQREKLPRVETPGGTVEISGRIAPPPARLYEFRRDERGAIRQNLDLASFRAETGLKLADVSVVEAGPASEGLLREWPRAAAGSERNYGYAVQWWAISALIAILYVWFQFIAPRRKVRPLR
jgi:surfeit locus 1 family protein